MLHVFDAVIFNFCWFYKFLGLGSILFAISIDNSDLNVFRPSPDSSVDTSKNLTNNEELEPKPVISKNIENGNGNLFSCTIYIYMDKVINDMLFFKYIYTQSVRWHYPAATCSTVSHRNMFFVSDEVTVYFRSYLDQFKNV